ncbi:hypothetical protein CR513_02408, partial [Mucuna pruriens]
MKSQTDKKRREVDFQNLSSIPCMPLEESYVRSGSATLQPLPAAWTEEQELQPHPLDILILKYNDKLEGEVLIRWQGLPECEDSWEQLVLMTYAGSFPKSSPSGQGESLGHLFVGRGGEGIWGVKQLGGMVVIWARDKRIESLGQLETCVEEKPGSLKCVWHCMIAACTFLGYRLFLFILSNTIQSFSSTTEPVLTICLINGKWRREGGEQSKARQEKETV